MYAGFKFNTLIENTSYTVQEVIEEEYYSTNHTFSSIDHGFYVSAAVIRYDYTTEPIEDPDIGTLKFFLKSWNIYDGENGFLKFEEIPTRPCKLSDFGETDDSYFYQTSSAWERDLEINWRKLKCPDYEKIKMYGNYDTE